MVDNDQNLHVAVLAFPFGTHAAPLFNLTRRLSAAAPHVTFSFFNTAKSNSSISRGSEDEGFVNIKVYDVYDGIPEGYVLTGKRQEDIELFIQGTPENFKKGLDKVVLDTKKKISCLLTDAFLWFAADMADEIKVPWVPLWTAGASALSSHFYTDLIRDTVGVNHAGRENEPLTFVPGLPSALRVKDLPLEVISGNIESMFARLLHRMAQTIPRATAVTLNSFDDLDPPVINDLKSKLKQCLTVGPFTLTSPSLSDQDPYGCIPWLHDQKPASVAYVSIGTVTTLPAAELAALAGAFEESKVPFLWSLKDDQKILLPDGFLERTSKWGKVVPWAPQSQVLRHVAAGVFVTHCGWNSVLESITGGVPMICRPFFGDQGLNGRLISVVWGIGAGAEGRVLSKVGVMNALDLILNKEEGKQMRDKVGVLKELAKEAVGPQGSSTKNFKALLDIVTKN